MGLWLQRDLRGQPSRIATAKLIGNGKDCHKSIIIVTKNEIKVAKVENKITENYTLNHILFRLVSNQIL